MAGKGQSPLLGYNTNVKHRGRVFHIQTEDSGVQHPHVITHVFADGGRILKSQKTSYAELLEAVDLQVQVKRIMQDQHKALFIALRDGQFDHLVDPDGSTRTSAVAPPPPELDTADLSAQWKGQPTAAAPPPAPPPTPSLAATPAVTPPARPITAARPSITMPTPSLPRTPTASGGATAAPASPRPSTVPSAPEGLARTASSAQTPSNRSGRYAPVRAPEILGSFKSKPAEGASIFGDGMMSEKSLDEVILAYLAEDLDDGKKR